MRRRSLALDEVAAAVRGIRQTQGHAAGGGRSGLPQRGELLQESVVGADVGGADCEAYAGERGCALRGFRLVRDR